MPMSVLFHANFHDLVFFCRSKRAEPDWKKHALFSVCVCVQIVLPPHLERIREKLAENIHELWVMNKIELGWTYGAVSIRQLHTVPETLIISSL